jgi:hypothetical protein
MSIQFCNFDVLKERLLFAVKEAFTDLLPDYFYGY